MENIQASFSLQFIQLGSIHYSKRIWAFHPIKAGIHS